MAKPSYLPGITPGAKGGANKGKMFPDELNPMKKTFWKVL